MRASHAPVAVPVRAAAVAFALAFVAAVPLHAAAPAAPAPPAPPTAPAAATSPATHTAPATPPTPAPSTSMPTPPAPTAADAPAAPAAPTGVVLDTKRPLRVAVYAINASGVDPKLGVVVTDSVVAEIRKLQHVSVVSMDEVRALLDMEAQKQLVGCSDTSCLAEVAEALGVDAIVVGNIAQIDAQLTFGLKRLDQRSANLTGQMTKQIEAGDKGAAAEGVLALVGPGVEQIFPELPLRPGMKRGVSPEAALRVNPPPLAPWIFYTGAAATGVAFTAGAVALLLDVGAYSSTQGFVDQKAAANTLIEGSDLNSRVGGMRGAFDVMAGAWGAAVVLGAGTGVAALFTDWNHYRDAE